MAKLAFTIINQIAREKLEISVHEYCIADSIYHLSNNPAGAVQGWCYASKESLGEFTGIKRNAVHTIIKRLIKKELVEKNPDTKNLRTTVKWYEKAVLLNDSIETIQGVSKRYTDSIEKIHQGSIEKIHNKNTTNNNNINVDALFDKFWKEYPNKKAKKTARKVFEKIADLEETVPKLMDALALQKQTDQWQKDNGRFIPHPDTWLNQERWEDEITADSQEEIFVPQYAKKYIKT